MSKMDGQKSLEVDCIDTTMENAESNHPDVSMIDENGDEYVPVSYTHLTLPTKA